MPAAVPTRWAQKRQKMLATSTVLQRFLNRTLKLFYRESNEHKEVSVTRKGTCQNCTYEIFARNFFGLRVQCYVREVRVGWPWEVRLPVQKWLCANLTPTRPRMRDGRSGSLMLYFNIFMHPPQKYRNDQDIEGSWSDPRLCERSAAKRKLLRK